MKKRTKKLKLAKETVRNLSLGRGHVAGGAFTDNCSNTCPYTEGVTCTCASCGQESYAVCESRNGAICPGSLCGNTCSC
jgi:hypothetical protein